MQGTSVKDKTLKGVKWSFIDNIVGSGVTFIVGLILARLLTPAEFGIIGIVTVFIVISNTIIDGGFSTALIRKLEVTDDDYNTVFYINLFVSILLVLLLVLFSNKIALFFNEIILEKVFPVMSLILLINALTIVQRADLTRRVDFKTQAFISLAASVGSGIIGITLALLGYNVWSLVWQQLSRQFINSLLLWALNRWKPKLRFSLTSFRELFGFGSKILGANLLNTVYKNIFNIIIGKIYSVPQLGQYTRAEQFNLILTNNLTTVIQRVSFPILSSIQGNKEHLTNTFRKFTIYSSLITFPLILGLGAIAKPLIIVLIGEKWLIAATYLQIMCVYGILYPLTNLNINMLNVGGYSNVILRLEIIKKILFIPVLIVGFYFDLVYMLWAVALYYYIEFIFNSWYSERLFNYGILKQAKDIAPILLISLLVSVCVWAISLVPLQNIYILLLQCITGLSLYFLLFEKTSLPEYVQLKKMAIIELRKLKKREITDGE